MEGHSNKPPTLDVSITMERIGNLTLLRHSRARVRAQLALYDTAIVDMLRLLTVGKSLCVGLLVCFVSGIILPERAEKGLKKSEALIRMEWRIRAPQESTRESTSQAYMSIKGTKILVNNMKWLYAFRLYPIHKPL